MEFDIRFGHFLYVRKTYVSKMTNNFTRLRLSLEIELSKVGETDFGGTQIQKKERTKMALKMVLPARAPSRPEAKIMDIGKNQ